MKKKKIYWPFGNNQFDAWEVESVAGQLVVRRNHALVKAGSRRCQGWDLWLDGEFLGAVGSRLFAELGDLTRRELKTIVVPACCGRYETLVPGQPLKPPPGWGGRRYRAGRPTLGVARRVRLSTTLEQRTIELIDEARGNASRGVYLDELIQGQRKG